MTIQMLLNSKTATLPEMDADIEDYFGALLPSFPALLVAISLVVLLCQFLATRMCAFMVFKS
jgi:hypothetical protein